MCYPSPGPRCSASAAAKVAKARHICFIYLRDRKTARDEGVIESDFDYNGFETAMKAVDKATAEYSITPAGIKELEQTVVENPSSASAINELEKAKTLRAARIAAVKDKGKIATESTHKVIFNTGKDKYSNCNLSENGAVLNTIDEYSPNINVMLKDSEAWSHKLNANEIEAVQWYTRGGYADVNGSLVNSNYKNLAFNATHYNENRTKDAIKDLDSALSKVDANRDVVVYRRHFIYNSDGIYVDTSLAEKQELFPVGSTYEPKFFMSTSLNPDNAPTSDSGSVIFLEIKAKRAASVSTIANSGTREQEFLLPRDGKYKVVGNSSKVTINNNRENQTLTVIQLEEI